MTMEEIKKRLTEIAAEIEQLGDAITGVAADGP